MFDAQKLWPDFLEQAKLYRQKKTKYFSIPKGKPYSVFSTDNGVIRVARDGGGNDDTISIVKFRTCIEAINNNRQGYFIPNAGIYNTVNYRDHRCGIIAYARLVTSNKGIYVA